MRSYRAIALVVALSVFVTGWSVTTAAPASATRIAKIDLVTYRALNDTSGCPPPAFTISCTKYAGYGVSLGGDGPLDLYNPVRVWTLKLMRIVETHGGGETNCTGTWSLDSLGPYDGDGLSGDFRHPFPYSTDCYWHVTGGTGRWTGVTDSVPGGTPQAISPVTVGGWYIGPPLGVEIPFVAGTPFYVGSLTFFVEP